MHDNWAPDNSPLAANSIAMDNSPPIYIYMHAYTLKVRRTIMLIVINLSYANSFTFVNIKAMSS